MPIKILEKPKTEVKEGEIDEEIKSRFWRKEEGQIVSGYIGPEFKGNWTELLPKDISPDMVYKIPLKNGEEWRLRSRYIRSRETIRKFSAQELEWPGVGVELEEGRCDPRKQEVGAEEKSQEEEELRPAA